MEKIETVEQEVGEISKDDVREALWCGSVQERELEKLLNMMLDSEKTPEEQRKSVVVPIFKNKGDIQSCGSYRGIKLKM